MNQAAWLIAGNAVVLVALVMFVWIKGVVLASNVKVVVRELQYVVSTTQAASELLLTHVENFGNQIDRNYAGVLRLEAIAVAVAANLEIAQDKVDHVASDLVVAQDKVDGVASDLEATHHRADQVGPGHAPGTASDAASRTDPNKGSK